MRNSLLFHVQYAKAFSHPEREERRGEIIRELVSLSLFTLPASISPARARARTEEGVGRKVEKGAKSLCAVEKCLRKVEKGRGKKRRKRVERDRTTLLPPLFGTLAILS